MARFLVLVASTAMVAGCRRDPPVVLESEPAVSAGHRATVSMGYRPGFDNLHSGIPDEVTYRLRLTRPGGAYEGPLDHFVVDPQMSSERSATHVSSGEFEAMKKTRPRVQIAPDAHALAVSRDGGARYRYVALDAGEEPLYCWHVTFAPDPSGDVWSAAPTTRDLVLGILRSRSDVPSSHYLSRASWKDFHAEFMGALAFACAGSDAELRKAVVAATVAPGEQVSISPLSEALVACAAQSVEVDADARAVLVAAVASQDPALLAQAGRAAEALAGTSDATVQEALAGALRTIRVEGDAADDDDREREACDVRARLAWSLASVTTNRRQASTAVLAVLVETARGGAVCPDRLSGQRAVVYAVRALAALEAGTTTLRVLARSECATPLDAWPSGFEVREGPENTDAACWARAALAQVKNVR